MKTLKTILIALLLPLAALAQPSHDAWNVLLQKYVTVSGKVNYKMFKADRSSLEAYLKTLATETPRDAWTRADKMAYWINAYNAFTVKLIVDNYPLSSITALDNGKPWDVQRIELGGKKYSLNQIENEIIRPQFKDPRIHFALNCAAKSCPPLYNRAFTPANLEKALTERTRRFLNDPNANTLSAERVQVSKIFEWYAADFGSLPAFLAKYSGKVVNSNAAVDYLDYDWRLNE
ncbi:MAG: DUF547 domain-containing protein [Saprospiraceae bacterium]|nr:DUF547 domain-containing protein [Saprospiraceae bacterium]